MQLELRKRWPNFHAMAVHDRPYPKIKQIDRAHFKEVTPLNMK